MSEPAPVRTFVVQWWAQAAKCKRCGATIYVRFVNAVMYRVDCDVAHHAFSTAPRFGLREDGLGVDHDAVCPDRKPER